MREWGLVGWGELAWAESRQCLVPGLAGVGLLCRKFWKPLQHLWEGQSHRPGVKVALPDHPPWSLPRDPTITWGQEVNWLCSRPAHSCFLG